MTVDRSRSETLDRLECCFEGGGPFRVWLQRHAVATARRGQPSSLYGLR